MDWQPLDDEARALRRRKARQRIRRRRWTAGLALLAAVCGVAAVLLLTAANHPAGLDQATATETVATRQRAPLVPPRPAEPAPADSEPPGRPIPILMYHATEAPPAGSPLPELWVPGETFAATMRALKEHGFNAVTMQDAYDYWQGRRRVPRQPIVLTFDDGFRSHVDNALPALRRLGWRGVLYLQVGELRNSGRDGISRAGVRRLLRAGWELGAHTISHADLTTLAPAQLHEQVAGARRQLQRIFQLPVDSFCYPAGKYDDTVVDAVREAGYVSATTVDPGVAEPGDDMLLLPRIRVNGSESPETVIQQLVDLGAATES